MSAPLQPILPTTEEIALMQQRGELPSTSPEGIAQRHLQDAAAHIREELKELAAFRAAIGHERSQFALELQDGKEAIVELVQLKQQMAELRHHMANVQTGFAMLEVDCEGYKRFAQLLHFRLLAIVESGTTDWHNDALPLLNAYEAQTDDRIQTEAQYAAVFATLPE